MIDDLRRELVAMRAEDGRVREELLASGALGGPYVPRMEEVHRKNAVRLRELIERYGWPAEDIAAKDGAEAAWFITQHAIGEPKFQKRALALLEECIRQKRVPAWHAAYLEDRIALHEGRAQCYGTQWVDDTRDGRARPWKLAEPERVNELRATVGLGPLPPVPGPGPDLEPEKQAEMQADQRWWEEWLASKGWRG